MIVAKQGEYGAALVTADGFFSLPAFPLESVVDPTGAGDTFAGGFVGYIAAHVDEEITDELLRQAMAHGTALASFNVEEFGTERIEQPRRRGDRRARAPAARVHAVLGRAGAAGGLSSPAQPCRRAEQPADLVDQPGIGSTIGCGVDAWTFIWLMFILKIPIVGLFLIVRWAVRQEPEAALRRGRRHRLPPAPAPPQPSAPAPAAPAAARPAPRCGRTPAPPRIRTVAARGRLASAEHASPRRLPESAA